MIKRIAIFLFLVSLANADIKPIMEAFNNGEVSPLILLRTKFGKYDNSCKTLQNMIPLSQGPVARRPGTYYIAEVKTSSETARLIPVEIGKDDAYITEWGNEYIRFYRDGGQIVQSSGTEDISALSNIVAHWTLNDLDGLVVTDASSTHQGTATTDISTLNTEGKVNYCLDFDGMYAVDIPDHANLSFDDSGANPFSIIGWIYINGEDIFQTIISKWQEDTIREWRLSVNEEQKLQLHLCDDSVTLGSNLVAQWKLNDNAANCTVTETNYAHPASLTTNTENIYEVGVVSSCLNFDGQWAATVTDHTELSFGDSSTDDPFSIAAWIYVVDGDTIQMILGKYDLTTGSELKEWAFYLDSGEDLNFIIRDESTDGYEIRGTAGNSLLEGWHFVVATYDATEVHTGIKLYVNNIAVGTFGYSDGDYVAMEDTAALVTMGGFVGNDGTLGGFWQDKLDNISLFDIVLTSANIANLYNQGVGTEELGVTFPYTVADNALNVGWHFVGATYEGTGGVTAANDIKLYTAGVLVSSSATNEANYVAMENTAATVTMGSQLSAGLVHEHIWQDKLDNIAIFSEELTAASIATLYGTYAYEIETEYSSSELFDIQYVQSADVMFLAHADHPPRKLSRLNHNLWTIEDVNYVTGPFMDENATDTTLKPSSVTGTIDIQASADTFSSGHIGGLWELRHWRTDADLSGVLAAVTSTESIDCEGDFKFTTHGSWDGTVKLERSDDDIIWETIPGGVAQSVSDTNISFADSESESGYKYRVNMTSFTSGTCTYNFLVYDHFDTGVVRITGYASPTGVTALVLNELGTASSTQYWSEGYWSDKNGWPQSLEFHQFRLWYGGSDYFPQTLWASQVDDYDNMKDGDLDNHALIYTLPNQNPIQWLLSQSYLMIGNLGGAGRFGEQDEVIAPTVQPQYYQQSRDGSAYIQPIMAGDAILYVERGGRKVREFVYAFDRDRFVSPDMTVLAEHITGDGIIDIAYQSRPDSTMWCVREDGGMPSMTYNRGQEVVGWALFITDGEVESVAVIPGSDEDEVWTVTKRNINDSDVRYIEQMQPRDWGDDQEDCFFVDSGLTWEGGATASITDMTSASPCVVTLSTWPVDGNGDNLDTGDQIKIESVQGMTQTNGNIYTMRSASVTGLTFQLYNSVNSTPINAASFSTYTSSGTIQRFENSWTGFGHLEGETITVLADGIAQSAKTISTGAFSITTWVNVMHAGLPYTSKIETMPIVYEGREGSVAASKKQVSKLSVNFFDTLGTLYGISSDTDECFKSSVSTLQTGWENWTFQHGFQTPEATIYLEQTDPYPLTIRAIIPEVLVTE